MFSYLIIALSWIKSLIFGETRSVKPAETSSGGLTPEKRAAIKRTWDIVAEDKKGNGVGFFFEFFRAHPDYKDYFRAFRGLSEDELLKSAKLRAHASTVMHSLSSVVENLDDLDCVVELMKKIVEAHHPRGVGLVHYQNLFKVFAIFLESALGDAFDAEAKLAWGEAISVLLSVISAHLTTLEGDDVGLTDSKKSAIRRTWDLVKADAKGNGVALFIEFFTAHPEYKDYFADFREFSLEELKTSAKLRAHGSTVVHSLTSVVESLDDLDCVVTLMEKIVIAHYPRGIRLVHYENLFTVFAAFLGKGLGDAMDEEANKAWGTAVTVLLDVIKQHLAKIEEQEAEKEDSSK